VNRGDGLKTGPFGGVRRKVEVERKEYASSLKPPPALAIIGMALDSHLVRQLMHAFSLSQPMI
jgi:hypothetical protein